MNDYRWKMLWDAQRADLRREAEQAQLAAQLPHRADRWRVMAVVAVVLIGMIALWIH